MFSMGTGFPWVLGEVAANLSSMIINSPPEESLISFSPAKIWSLPQPTPRFGSSHDESELRVPQATSCSISERIPASLMSFRAMPPAGRGISLGAGRPAGGSAGSRCARIGTAQMITSAHQAVALSAARGKARILSLE
jgi:hypothetical protein